MKTYISSILTSLALACSASAAPGTFNCPAEHLKIINCTSANGMFYTYKVSFKACATDPAIELMLFKLDGKVKTDAKLVGGYHGEFLTAYIITYTEPGGKKMSFWAEANRAMLKTRANENEIWQDDAVSDHGHYCR